MHRVIGDEVNAESIQIGEYIVWSAPFAPAHLAGSHKPDSVRFVFRRLALVVLMQFVVLSR
jgi:hypothetical protein